MYQKNQSQLAQSSLSCSTTFSILSQGRGTYLSFDILSALFCDHPEQQNQQCCRFSFSFFFFFCLLLLFIIIRSGLLAEIMWSVFMSKPHRSLCESFSRTGAGLCKYHFLALSRDIPLRRWKWDDCYPLVGMNSENPSKKWPLRKNVGHRGDINRCWYLVTSGRRTPVGKKEQPNDWLGP